MPKREDFEMGDEILEVERRPRSGVVISVRLSPEESDQLNEYAETRKVSISYVARRALADFVHGVSFERLAMMPWGGATSGNPNLQLIIPAHRPLILTNGAPTQTNGAPIPMEVTQAT